MQVKKIPHNATVGVFSPSEPIVEKRKGRFSSGLSILESLGYKTKLGPHALSVTNYTAGSVKDRVSDIHSLLDDFEVDVLISSWGGKSCNQTVAHIDYDLVSRQRKPILGFSDAAVLLNNISAKTGLITFYGPNVIGKLDETEHSDLGLLKENFFSGNLLGNVERVSCKVIKSGVAEGKLVGGNLSTFVLGVVCSTIPDSYYDNAILFWEDAGNPPQIINQYLTAIANRGIFSRISGMIVGDFIAEEPTDWKKTDDFVSLKQILSLYDFPVLYAPTFGHKKLENPLLPIGANCKLDTDNFSLKLLEPIAE